MTKSSPSESSYSTSESNTEQRIQSQIKTCLEKIDEAQKAATQARSKANATDDPDEKQELIDDAVKQEKIAIGQLKIVKRLQSGVWQGGLAGAGIGTGVGMGVGTVVGTVVGGVTAIPTGLVGLGSGALAGAVHGPWFKIIGDGEGDEGEMVDEDAASQKAH